MWPFKSKPKCAHDWKVQGKTVAKPCADLFDTFKIGSGHMGFAREFTQGATRYLLTCAKCGSVETHVVYGVQESEKPPP